MIKSNRDAYAEQCKEDLDLKARIKFILLNRYKVGAVVNEMFYLIKDEIKKAKENRRY